MSFAAGLVRLRAAPWRVLLGCFFLVALSGPAAGQATRPAEGPFEQQLIRRGANASAPTTQGAASQKRPVSLLDTRRVILALGIVLALIFLLRWLGRRVFPNVTGARSAGVVRVLGRSPISTRQQVLLVQVGQRVLVLGDNGAQLSPLSEISDRDEVAQLIGQLSGSVSSEKFNHALGDAAKEYEDEVEPARPADESAPESEPVAATRSEIEGLMSKVRDLARQLGR